MMTDDNTNNPEEVTPVEKEEAPASDNNPPSPKSELKMTRTDSGGVDADFGKFHVELEAKQVPLVGYFMASFIFMIASLAQKEELGKGWYGYAVSIGVLGMCASLAGMVLLKYKSEVDQTYLAYGLVVWAIVGACFMTFGDGPFTVTGNGYFAVWGMTIFGVQHCGATQAVSDGVKSLSSLAGLGLASIIMIVAISYEVAESTERGNSIYTLVLSCLTIVLAGGLWFVDTKKQDLAGKILPLYRFVVLTIFAIMWVVAACLVTFDGPFINTGNGYFVAWTAAILSIFAALAAKQSWSSDDSPV